MTSLGWFFMVWFFMVMFCFKEVLVVFALYTLFKLDRHADNLRDIMFEYMVANGREIAELRNSVNKISNVIEMHHDGIGDNQDNIERNGELIRTLIRTQAINSVKEEVEHGTGKD